MSENTQTKLRNENEIPMITNDEDYFKIYYKSVSIKELEFEEEFSEKINEE